MTLSRSLLNSALAIAGITAAFGFATEAQAATFTVAQVNTPGFTFTVLDKVFSNFSIPVSTTGFQALDEVTIDVFGGSFSVAFNPAVANAGQTFITGSGSLSYKVTIPSPTFVNVFKTADNVTSVGGSGAAPTRTLAVPAIPFSVPINSSGNFPAGVQSITVQDSWNMVGSRRINSFSDEFMQDPINPEPQIPEPSAVLGLLALGLCGTLVGRQKKG